MAIDVGFKYNAEDLLPYSTVRISVLKAGRPIEAGTGFFYRIYLDEFHSIDFIVTAKHILEDQNGKLKGDKTEFVFNLAKQSNNGKENPATKIKLEKEKVVVDISNWINLIESNESIYPNLTKEIEADVSNSRELWYEFPKTTDLAFIPLAPIQTKLFSEKSEDLFNNSIYYNAINPDEMIHSSPDSLMELSLRSLVFMGYPADNWDIYNNLPIALSGIVSSPYNINYENQPNFLMNGYCVAGSSGSPVFLFERFTPFPREEENKESIVNVVDNHLIFVGVLTAAKTDQNKLHLNIGYVLRSNVIDEIIRSWCIDKGYLDRKGADNDQKLHSLIEKSKTATAESFALCILIDWIFNSFLNRKISRMLSDKQIGNKQSPTMEELDNLIGSLKEIHDEVTVNVKKDSFSFLNNKTENFDDKFDNYETDGILSSVSYDQIDKVSVLLTRAVRSRDVKMKIVL